MAGLNTHYILHLGILFLLLRLIKSHKNKFTDRLETIGILHKVTIMINTLLNLMAELGIYGS